MSRAARSIGWLRATVLAWGRQTLCGVLFAGALFLLVPGMASAHAHLVQADPAPGSAIARTPAIASFVFDEPLNPALTRVHIADAMGREVAGAGGYLAPGHHGEWWQLPLPPLHDGTYSVFWTSESAIDGHVMSSFYTFRVAPSGAADSIGAVTGSAAGVYDGGAGAGAAVGLSREAVTTVLFHWLGLVAQALWLGALIVEVVVLRPARIEAHSPEARLACAAAARLSWLVRGALVVAVWALIGEVFSLAAQGSGGNWGQAMTRATLGGILSAQNGHYIRLRFIALLGALLLAAYRPIAAGTGADAPDQRIRRGSPAVGIVAPVAAAPPRAAIHSLQVLLAAGYMLLVAFSGHAADVSPNWLSFPIDWLHLLCTAAWVGGIGALAYGVLPVRRLLPPRERAAAVLRLLDSFSPVAYIAIAALALTGLYNAVNHLSSSAMLAETTYGQFLLLKLALVGLLMVLSASHVYVLRPRLASLSRVAPLDGQLGARERGQQAGPSVDIASGIHKGLNMLSACLHLEAGAGAIVLLATAFMSQTLPPTVATGPPTAGSTRAAPAAISATATSGDLRVRLTVSPPLVGTVTFTLRLWEHGIPLSSDTAAAVIHLYLVTDPTVRATLTPSGSQARFIARGSLSTSGTWHADVLVRTATVNEYRTLSFTFTAGTNAAFLASVPNPSTVAIAVTPGLFFSPNTVSIRGLRAPAVRILSQSLSMRMGILSYPAVSLGGNRWRVRGVYAPMNGRWGLTVQVQHGRSWISVRQIVYQVPLNGTMHVLAR